MTEKVRLHQCVVVVLALVGLPPEDGVAEAAPPSTPAARPPLLALRRQRRMRKLEGP